MHVSAFGSVFLPAVVFIFLFRRAWLLPLLCVSAVLHSPSLLDVQIAGRVHGLTSFVLVSALVTLLAVQRAVADKHVALGSGEQRLVVKLWVALGAVSLAGAVLLPVLFAGTPVIAPLADGGLDALPQPLAWSANHAAQALNLLLVFGVLLWLLQQRIDPALPRRMWRGVMLALAVSVLVGLQQRLAWNGLLPLFEQFWASNPGYDHEYRSWAGPVPRVSWPFVEPAYASAWFAAMLGGFSVLFLGNVRRDVGLLGAALAAFALVNTLGATGFIASVIFLAIALALALAAAVTWPARRGGIAYRLVLSLLAGACLLLGVYLVLRHYALLEVARHTLDNVLHGRSQTVWGDIRPQANWHAVRVAIDTWGLGAGMGSHRSSSYLANLLGNVGVPGLLLFLAAAGVQMALLARRAFRRPEAATLFFLGSGAAVLIAVSIAIPDRNWPVLWLLLWGGVLCLDRQDTIGDRPPDAP